MKYILILTCCERNRLCRVGIEETITLPQILKLFRYNIRKCWSNTVENHFSNLLVGLVVVRSVWHPKSISDE